MFHCVIKANPASPTDCTVSSGSSIHDTVHWSTDTACDKQAGADNHSDTLDPQIAALCTLPNDTWREELAEAYRTNQP